MPIIVKDYTWTQSDTQICVNLPLKGTKPTNIDFLNSQEFFKVSYPPFLFECWLYSKIKDENYTAVVKDGIISYRFTKLDEANWPQLFHPDFGDKEKLKEIRNEAIGFSGERERKLSEQKAKDKEENKKTALKEQMKIEEEERRRIDEIKESEKKRASEEIEKLKAIQKSIVNEINVNNGENNGDKIASNDNIRDHNKKIFNDEVPTLKNKKEEKEIPGPRKATTIQIKLTPRVFPTPSRESQGKLEKEWLEKQAEARKMTELPDEFKDLTADEKNLDWLKEKAKNYYQQENYQAAIGVYNHAVRLFPKIPALYSNRAACHFNVNNLMKCVEDCSKALELLSPPVPNNADSRLKAHVRRGTAFCHLELYAEGLMDYRAALKIDPDNQELKTDAKKIENIILDKKSLNSNDESEDEDSQD